MKTSLIRALRAASGCIVSEDGSPLAFESTAIYTSADEATVEANHGDYQWNFPEQEVELGDDGAVTAKDYDGVKYRLELFITERRPVNAGDL